MPLLADLSDRASEGGLTVNDGPDVRFFRYGVRMRVYEDSHYLETMFPDDTKVGAAPQDNDEYRATAQRLGYGEDVWRMCQDHEQAHTTVMQALGLCYSPTLWAVAHGHQHAIPDSPGEMAAEEDLVLAYQRWARLRALHSRQ